MHPFNPTEILEDLLRQYSPTLHEAPAVETLAGWLRRLGFSVEIDSAGSARGSRGDGPREIVLLGHIDTVPGQIDVRREGDLLYGRGAVDAKGPLACFAAAAAQASIPAGWRVTVIGAVGEEGDSRGAKQVRDDYAQPPAYTVIGEPSRWDYVTLGYKGSAWFDYHLSQPLTHTAAGSESACEAAVRFWNDVQARKEAFNAGRGRAFDQLTASLREMASGQDGFYETAQLRFNLRLPPEMTVAQVEALLAECAGAGRLTLLDGIECYRGDKNTPLVRAFLAAIRKEGGKPGFYVKTGTADMNIVGPAWGTPILAYGPGDSSLDHTPNEHISIEEYLRSVRVLQSALEGLMAG
jgi:[amino group carrier protein]-lysine/ornithine hydrolase